MLGSGKLINILVQVALCMWFVSSRGPLLQLFLKGGYSVTLFDVVEDQLKGAVAAVEEQLKSLESKGLLREGQTADQLLKHVSICTELKTAMEGADYVQVQRS